MSTKIKTISLLTVLALSAVVLTACHSNTKEPSGFAPKTTQSSKSTSSSSSSVKTSSSKVTASEKTTSTRSQEQASAGSSQVTSGSTPPSSSSTTPVSSSPAASNQETKSATETTGTSALPPRHHVQPVSPEAAAGNWGSLGTINADGTLAGSSTIVGSVESQAQGVLYLNIIDAGGYGVYAHYYPAGVAIPFENMTDPTDTSRDRLIMGNSGYLGISQEQIGELLTPNVHYRQ